MTSPITTASNRQDSSLKRRLLAFRFLGPTDYKNILWRRKAVIAATILGITLLVAGIAHKLPNQYQAVATVMVDPGKVPESYVKSTATIDANQRLALLQERILSDGTLGRVMDELGLYRNLRGVKNEGQIADLMRSQIAVLSTSAAPPARTLKYFTVAFTAADAVLAARVSNRLASLFIEENLKLREQQVAGTADFFDDQLQRAKREVDEQSQKLAQLKARHVTELPEAQNLHLQALTSAQLALREEGEALSRDEQQKASLEALLANSPNVINLDNSGQTANTGLEEQLEKLQGEMEQLRSHYGPSYPDVLIKAAEIQGVEQKIKTLEQQGRLDSTSQKRQHNPAVESQITQTEAQIKKREARQSDLQAQIRFHVAALSGVPGVQEEVSAATNDVAVASDRYKRLEDRKFGADMFSDVEARQQGERFVLLDPAQPPQAPSTPNRPLIEAIGLGSGILLSLLLVAILEFLDPAVKTEREVVEHFKEPIFGAIPRLSGAPVRRRKFWSTRSTAQTLLLILGFSGFSAPFVHQMISIVTGLTSL